MEKMEKIQEINAYAVVIRDNKVLILERHNGIWEFPGGGVDFGEHPYTTAVRETEEETGLKISNGKLCCITSAVYEKGNMLKHSIYVVYTFSINKEENINIVLSKEHKHFTWIGIKDEMEINKYKLGKNVKSVFKTICREKAEKRAD